jgi:hypothetical protein
MPTPLRLTRASPDASAPERRPGRATVVEVHCRAFRLSCRKIGKYDHWLAESVARYQHPADRAVARSQDKISVIWCEQDAHKGRAIGRPRHGFDTAADDLMIFVAVLCCLRSHGTAVRRGVPQRDERPGANAATGARSSP